ncbi:conserved phage C-terminal domain-containing protein [Sporosarcina sp. OR05]|uniref:conserved phage C-terminal domain-containing protein n=1 Tax=Sporosarcina sp. OR05 TaxID=2969819 RepID=UPI00352AD87B
MNLLISESPLQVLPTLAVKVGLNKAIILQQLYYRLLISKNIRDGHRWFYKSFEDWQAEEFPFWSVSTVKRAMKELEDDGYVISTSAHNRIKMDRTKWYRINTEKLRSENFQKTLTPGEEKDYASAQNDTMEEGKTKQSHCVKMTPAITKEVKSNKKDNVEMTLDVASEIINYLNQQTGKAFKPTTKATKDFINGRLREGHTVEHFKTVIDTKVKQWLNDPKWDAYLRPSTLFNPKNFENYLNEAPVAKPVKPIQTSYTPPVLDFGKGEE